MARGVPRVQVRGRRIARVRVLISLRERAAGEQPRLVCAIVTVRWVMRPVPEVPGPGQASVWEYPRPPALRAEARALRVVWLGREIAHTTRGYRVLETSHPPVYYLPLEDVCREVLAPSRAGMSWCEWKGAATYWDLALGEHRILQAAWSYEAPTEGFAPIAGHIAFYAGKVDACYVGEVQAQAQPGGFYGGWVTPDVVGPFKGVPGSWGW